MAVRVGRRAELRRAALSRPGFVALACALYLGAGVSATWPAVQHFDSRFLAGGAPGHGEAAAGDHLQTGYRLWLVGHQLEHGRAPWRDPYTFRPVARPTLNFQGWPFGLPYWPLVAVFGPVVAWNLFVLLTYLGAGGLACAWLRELRLARAPAVAGGLAFAIAPYRVVQSAGHLLGPISLLLPLALWAFERGRRGSAGWLALAAAALASIPLSGQVHLALGAIPFFVLYALVRTRDRRALIGAAAATLAAVVAGVLVQRFAIASSISASGRSLKAVSGYSAHWRDLVSRHRSGSETFVFLGWFTSLAALVGLGLLLQARRYGLAVALALGAVVPILLALGTNLPLYSALWHALPPLRYPRVPERLMPIACLAIGALVAFAVARTRSTLLAVLAVAALFVDLHARVYGASVADGANRAYAAVRGEPAGRLLELPVFVPDVHYGSVYLYYDMQALRERPVGYSTVAPKAADRLASRLERLNCGDWTGGTDALLDRLGVRFVAFHSGLYDRNTAVPDRSWFAWQALLRHGFRALARDGVITLFARRGSATAPGPREPDRSGPVFCQGWYGPTASGRPMSEHHAPFWIYGTGRLRLGVSSPGALPARFGVDGRRAADPVVSRRQTVVLPLRGRGWHLITVDTRSLHESGGRMVGLELHSATLG